MPKNSSQIVEAQSNIIRRMMGDNKTDREIIRELNMPEQTFYLYKRRIQKQDSQIWEKVHIDSAKYRATQFIQSLEECYYFNKKIMGDQKQETKHRIEASRTMCEAPANTFKIVNEGPTYRISLPTKW